MYNLFIDMFPLALSSISFFLHIYFHCDLMIWRRPNNESCESSDTEDPDVDFEQLVNQAEEEENKD